MSTLARLDIVISANSGTVAPGLRTATRGLKGVERQARSTETAMTRMGNAFKVVLGAAIIRQVARAATAVFNLGASVEETQSKFSTVFASSTDSVQEFLDVFANKAGLTNREAQELLATTGAIAQGMGFAVDASAAYARQVAILAADISSFNDVAGGAAVVIEAINAAAAGEREQLKKWGIVILDVDVKARALAETGKTVISSLTLQERTAATLSLIYDRVGVAAGDLDRTQLSAANTARRVASRFRELAEEASSALLPVFGQLLGALDDNSSAFDAVSTAIGKVGRFISTGIAQLQLFAVSMAVMAAKVGVGWAKVKDAAAKALGATGVAGILSRFQDFMAGLSPTVQALLGFNPIVAVATSRFFSDIVSEDTGLAVLRAQNNFNRIEKAAKQMRENILKALNTALTISGVRVPDRPDRADTDRADKASQKLATIVARVEAGLRSIAAMEGIDTPFELLKEKAKLLEKAVRDLASAGLAATVEYAAFREELERLRIGVFIMNEIEEDTKKLNAQLGKSAETVSRLQDVATNFADDFTTRLARLAEDGKAAFKGLADVAIFELNRIAIQLAIINAAQGLFPGNATLLSILGAPAPKGKATGGLLTPFVPVKVHRDEIIVPLTPSLAVPSSVAARGVGGGPTFNISIPLNVQSLDPLGARRVLEQQRPFIVEAVVEGLRNSGALRSLMGGR